MELVRESRARDADDGVDKGACIVDRKQFFNTQVTRARMADELRSGEYSRRNEERGMRNGELEITPPSSSSMCIIRAAGCNASGGMV